NGAESSDYVEVQISPDNGTTTYPTVRVAGNVANGNSYWSYAGALGNAMAPYDADVTPVTFNAGSQADNSGTQGHSTITITGLPSVSQMRIRVVMVNNSSNERWSI